MAKKISEFKFDIETGKFYQMSNKGTYDVKVTHMVYDYDTKTEKTETIEAVVNTKDTEILKDKFKSEMGWSEGVIKIEFISGQTDYSYLDSFRKNAVKSKPIDLNDK